MSDRLRHAIVSLRRWAEYFFQPCPHGLLRAIAGAVLAAAVAACLLLVFHLSTQGFRRTIALLPRDLASGLETLTAILTPVPHPLPPIAPWRQNLPAAIETPAAPPAQAFQTGRADQYRRGTNTFVRAPLRTDTLPYLDLPSVPLSEAAKQVDYALTQTMLRLDLGWSAFQLISYERRRTDTDPNHLEKLLPGMGGAYLLQRLRVYLPLAEGHTPETFTTALGEMLTIWSERASLHKTDALRLTIQVDKTVTHELFLSPQPGGTMASPAPDAPLLTIVIDDMGANLEAAQRLLHLGMPVTLSIWPRATHAARVADMAWNAGREILIHQPAEPLDFPAAQPGPGALFARMSHAEIAALFRDNISRVPHAVGVNNHMGSRFTTDKPSVAALCAVAAEHGLFVLDSLTHPRSLLALQAAQQGLAAYRRAVFLDDPLSRDAIRNALREAEQSARKHGQAIAIGHPHPETLDMLQEWLHTRDTDIRLVPLRSQRPLF